MKKVKTLAFKGAQLLAALLICISCNRSGTKYSDTPTTGNIKISVDETFKPIAQAEIQVFEGIYRYAKIKAEYKPEIEIFKDIIKDSVRLIISSRKLNQKEADYFKSVKFFPKETRIAVDGIALIVNNTNPDTLISINMLKDIVTGKISSWKQMNPKSRLSKIKVVFDNPNSSTVRFIIDSVCKGRELSSGLSATKDNSDVVEIVSANPGAIGIIGVNWVSDQSDSTAMSFLNKIKVMSVSLNDKPTAANSFKPYQAYLSTGDYPLRRDVYVINADPRSGLPSGFASFLASDRGQRIILKSGILPATQPVRIVHVNNEY